MNLKKSSRIKKIINLKRCSQILKMFVHLKIILELKTRLQKFRMLLNYLNKTKKEKTNKKTEQETRGKTKN
jgi:hypothetical protein